MNEYIKRTRRMATQQERKLVHALLSGEVTPVTMCGSTSICIAALLATGRYEALPAPYMAKEDAWDRLNSAQRAFVREHNAHFRAARWNTPVRYG
jgi:hypothetical protein